MKTEKFHSADITSVAATGDYAPDSMKAFIPSGNKRLDKQLQFTIEIDKMTHIMRRTVLIDGSRRENDAEHSWHIAVMALMFSEYAQESVDVQKAVKMAVVHDLVEIYAGDTFAYDKSGNKDKVKREKEAADKLFSILPEDNGREIRALWEEFEQCESADSKYANCMDRLQPFIHNTMTQGHTWIQGSVCKKDVLKRMDIIYKFLPGVTEWLNKNIEHGIAQGWIKE